MIAPEKFWREMVCPPPFNLIPEYAPDVRAEDPENFAQARRIRISIFCFNTYFQYDQWNKTEKKLLPP